MFTRLSIAVILSLSAVSSSYAHDSARIDELERELLETQKRLSILESMFRKKDAKEHANNTGEVKTDEGWKFTASWRELAVGMSTGKVLEILGDPHKVKGASVSNWYYENGGSLVFWDGYLKSWSEPE